MASFAKSSNKEVGVFRPLKPGSTGWTAEELDQAGAHMMVQPRFEIVRGVLTSTAPAR